MGIITGTSKYGGCGWCYSRQHDAHSCPYLQQKVSAGNIKAIKYQKRLTGTGGRLCGYCAHEEHSSGMCPTRFEDYRKDLVAQRDKAEKAFEWLKEIGFGPGAMLSGMARESGWNSKNKDDKIVVIGDFNNRSGVGFFKELLYGNNRNWYAVTAVDTTNETVRNVYLPFHPVYAPKPTSMKVQVIHRASDEDIEKMRKFVPGLSNVILEYATAEEFFEAGYRFQNGTNRHPEIIKIHN